MLTVALACPWACRCLAYINLKGLEDVIAVDVVAPVWEETKPGEDDHRGWVFDTSVPDCTSDRMFGSRTLRDLYDALETGESRFTTPLLVDMKTKKAVNNESSEITKMLDSVFNEFAKHPEVTMFPEALVSQIEEQNDFIYNSVNNGVYRSGFAKTQEAYDKAVTELFKTLDVLEERLSTSRYMNGETLTDTDVRLFMTLVRFDPVYVVHFKCAKRAIREYLNLAGYTRELYQHSALRATVNLHHITQHYYCSHGSINPYHIVPLTDSSWMDAPHGRDALPTKP